MTYLWQILAGIFGVAVYFLWRYDRKGPLSFGEYIRTDLIELIKGLAGFGVLYVGWTAIVKAPVLPDFVKDLAGLDYATCALLGFAAKKVVDYTVMRLEKPKV